MFVILLLLIISTAAGIGAGIAIRAWPQADPTRSATAAVEDQLVRWRRLRGFIRSRMDPATATGLALTVALLAVVVVGIGIGVVAYMIRTNSGVVRIDQTITRWAMAHTGTAAFRMLEFLTALGSTPVIIVVALAGATIGWWKRRDISIPFFFTLVVLGQLAASNLIKFAVERVRPDLGPLGPLGTPSFPSGHSTAAAATYAALALVLGRDRTPRARSVLAGIAVGIAVAVACSRVLLGVHWFSDVVAGLALGWTWFALCAVAFGGRVLWFGAPAATASAPALSRDSVGSTR
ncbi:MAG TPA: phosphatase PAP2 family protein [Actinomycetota bacterium]|nr:phosphatase PAP2 family protein [Actinomycetota bacterium]